MDEVAELTGAPRNYLGKTLGALVKAGLLRSARGPLGGFTLAVDTASVTVARVADLFAEPRAPRRCLTGDRACDPNHPCAAHAVWTAMTAAARAPLDATTLAHLLAAPTDAAAPTIDPTFTLAPAWRAPAGNLAGNI